MAVDGFQMFRQLFLIPQDVSAHAEVFLHAHAGEYVPALRHMGKAQADDGVGGDLLEVLSVQRHGAGGRRQQAGDGVERRGLSRAVGSDEGHQLPVAHREGDALQGMDCAVMDVQVFDFQHRSSLLTRQDMRR